MAGGPPRINEAAKNRNPVPQKECEQGRDDIGFSVGPMHQQHNDKEKPDPPEGCPSEDHDLGREDLEKSGLPWRGSGEAECSKDHGKLPLGRNESGIEEQRAAEGEGGHGGVPRLFFRKPPVTPEFGRANASKLRGIQKLTVTGKGIKRMAGKQGGVGSGRLLRRLTRGRCKE